MDSITCPYCASTSVRLQEAMFTVRLVESPEGGGFIERKCPIYRCNACGHTFDEVEGDEGSIDDASRAFLDGEGTRKPR